MKKCFVVRNSSSKLDNDGEDAEADVIVIGSGIGGLSCAALLARYEQDVVVLESHDVAGGAAHSFDVKGYKFDSGPSLFSGLQSRGPQANPLAQVLDALGESVPCATYDSWMVHVPEADFLSRIGPTEFLKDLQNYAGPEAVREWQKLLVSSTSPFLSYLLTYLLPPATLAKSIYVSMCFHRMLYFPCLQLQWLFPLYLFEEISVFFTLLLLDTRLLFSTPFSKWVLRLLFDPHSFSHLSPKYLTLWNSNTLLYAIGLIYSLSCLLGSNLIVYSLQRW
jgi:phytoene dehydrogenase-like protein